MFWGILGKVWNVLHLVTAHAWNVTFGHYDCTASGFVHLKMTNGKSQVYRICNSYPSYRNEITEEKHKLFTQ
jgi:hypothetical protein